MSEYIKREGGERKPVVGYENRYEVDALGNVFSVDRTVVVNDNGRIYEKHIGGRTLKTSLHTAGYKVVGLTKNGKTKLLYVHRIVAEAFIPNPLKLPFINHKDENKENDCVENLEWCTPLYNNTYGDKTKRQAEKIKGRTQSEEHRRKRSTAMKKYWEKRKRSNDYCSYGERKEKNDE